MEMLQVVVGQHYGYREHAHTYEDPISRVEAVKLGPPKSRRVKVAWAEGENEGLEKWVPQIRLVVRWDEVEAFLRDEECLLAAWRASGDAHGSTEWKAVKEVMFALPGEVDVSLCWTASDELLEMENVQVGAAQLGLDPQELLAEPYAYVDRFGHYFAPFPVARRAARICCQRFTREVLTRIDREEKAIREAILSGYYESPGPTGIEFDISRERASEWLHEKDPIYARIRDWCGETAVSEFNELAALRDEIERLRGLVGSAASWLENLGQKAKANSLRRDLN